MTTETLSVSTSNSWTSYESGTFAHGSYTFTSVLYTETSSQSITDDVAARQTFTGSGAMTVALSGPGQVIVAYDGSLATSANSTSYNSVDCFAFSSYESFTSVAHVGGTSSLYEAGSFNNGSYSFGSVVGVRD